MSFIKLIKQLFVFFSFFFFVFSSALAQNGAKNLGFEEGELYWTTVSEAEGVSVVGEEGPGTSPTYEDLDITVEPDAESLKMLRLGLPKQISENMNVGGNTVSQTFNSYNDTHILSFWLFSWDHRQTDSFTINVTQTSDPSKSFNVTALAGGDLSVVMDVDQSPQTCSQTPCVFFPSSNKQGNLVNTGWQRAIITGLPTDGSEVTVTYSLDGIGNQGHPAWAYVDSWNHDPVANLTVTRTNTIEGSVSRFIDRSTDPDPGDAISKRVWEITNGSKTEIRHDAKEIVIIASNQGTVSAKLTVFDRFGGSDTIQSGETGPDGIVPSITFENGPIFANNLLTYSVVAGSTNNVLTVRYAKPGWEDQVTPNWEINSGGGSLDFSNAKNITYPVPMMLKGVASIPFNAPDEPGTTTVLLTLSDSDGAEPVEREISINVLAASVFTINQDDDGNNSPATATPVSSGTVDVGYLNKRGDIDFYKITDENGDNLPEGSEVFVRLRNVGADYDLFFVKRLPTEAKGDYEELGLAIEEAGQLFGSNSYGFANLFGSNSYGFANLFGSNAYGFANLFGANSYGFANLFGSNSYGFANLFGSNSYGFANLFGSNAYGFANLFGSNSYGFANLFGSNSYGFANLFGSNSYGFANLDDDALNGIESVVFSSSTGEYSWESVTSNGLLHSLWLRDSQLYPFTQQAKDNGFDFSQLPLSEAIYLPQSGFVGEKDIGISETGLKDLISTGYYVSSMSVNEGYNDEMMLIKTTNSDDIYIAIASDGEFGSTYSLQVEHSIPTKLEQITNGACIGSPLVPSGNGDSSEIIHTSSSGDESVMYVVNPQRMIAQYGQVQWDELYSSLQSFVNQFGGKILAINDLINPENGKDLYAEMDTHPCQVNRANLVADAIRDLISSYKGQAKSVVIVGADNQIPFYRVNDLSRMVERDYLPITPIDISSIQYSAMFHSNILTDKYYANDYSVKNMPVKILIPEWAVSRLVETPDDIIAAINEQVANNYKIDMNNAMVSAYDVVFDSGKEIANTLSLALDDQFDNVTEIPFAFDMNPENAWTSASIQCFMLGDDSQIPGCEAKNIASLNGHFGHDFLVSQSAFLNGTNDYITTSDIDNSDSEKLSGNYIFTPGCHAGLNITIPTGAPSDTNTSDQQYPDFPQSYLRKGATYLAGTGYGIAGVNTIAFSEKLMTLHTKLLVSGGTIGNAVKDTDTVYLLNALNNGLNAFDLKAMYQNELYGFTETSIGTGVELPALSNENSCGANGDSQLFTLTIIDDEEQSAVYQMNKNCTDSGQFYDIDGNSTSVINRPVEPKSATSYTSGAGDIHAVLLESANYINTPGPVDPVFFTPTTDNATTRTEQSFCQQGRYWPSQLVGYSSNETDTTINFISGQFECLNEDEQNGMQRLYTNATVKVLRSTSTDFTKPLIESVDPGVNDLGHVVYSVEATDESGIGEIILTIYLENGIKNISSGPLTGGGPYLLELTPEDSVLALNNNTAITVIDVANNISVASSKGRGMEQIIVDLDETSLVSSLSPKELTATIKDFNTRRAIAHSMSYVWDFGDGHYETGIVFNKNNNDGDDDFDYVHPSLVIDEVTGDATISTTHQYNAISDITVKFKVTDSAGGIGTDELELQHCGDPVGDVDSTVSSNGDLAYCDVSSSGTQVTILVKVADGGVISPDYQYRLYLDYTNDGVSDLKLTYDNGKIGKTNKVDNLTATSNGQILEISFDLAPTGWTSDLPLNWYMETQSGVKKGMAIGYPDVMPDSGYFSY